MAEQAMIKFYYRARDKKGQAVHGDIEAINQKSALKAISGLNLIPIEVGETKAHKFFVVFENARKAFLQKLPRKDLLIFTQQLQTIYAVGIPILRGLEIIQQQTENKYFKNVILQMIEDITQGQTLSGAIEKHPNVFDSVFVNLIRVGEVSGQLEIILDRIYSIVETREENSAKVKTALFYPKMVVGFMAVVFIVIVNFVIPKLKDFLARLGADLPPITKFLLAISDFFVRFAPLLIIFSIAGYVGFKMFTNTKHGKLLFDRLILKMPIIGSLILMIEMNSFCIIMELLIRSGVNIIEGFAIVRGTAQNALVAQDIETCRKEVEKGNSIAKGLAMGETIPAMVTNLVTVGEEAGALEKALNRVAKFYKLQIDYKINNLSKAIEPLLLFLIFGMVLVLALGVFMPIWSMSSAIKK